MTHRIASIAAGALGLLGLAAPALALPNPASVFCVKNGGKSVIESTGAGQKGYCVFPDGTKIDEWVYFRNKHRTRN